MSIVARHVDKEGIETYYHCSILCTKENSVPTPKIITVLGYHGTSREIADIILAPGDEPRNRLRSRENRSDWLGDGIYFFQDAPLHAREWPMLRMPEHTRIMDPVVLCAELTLDEHCLDMLDINASNFISREYVRMKAEARRRRLRLPRNRGPNRRFDCALVNFAVDQIEARGDRVNSIRSAFNEGQPIVPKSQIYSHAHVQIVVRPGRLSVIGRVWQHQF